MAEQKKHVSVKHIPGWKNQYFAINRRNKTVETKWMCTHFIAGDNLQYYVQMVNHTKTISKIVEFNEFLNMNHHIIPFLGQIENQNYERFNNNIIDVINESNTITENSYGPSIIIFLIFVIILSFIMNYFNL